MSLIHLTILYPNITTYITSLTPTEPHVTHPHLTSPHLTQPYGDFPYVTPYASHHLYHLPYSNRTSRHLPYLTSPHPPPTHATSHPHHRTPPPSIPAGLLSPWLGGGVRVSQSAGQSNQYINLESACDRRMGSNGRPARHQEKQR